MSLVGENERLLLKDILKTCKVPAKMRIVPQGKHRLSSRLNSLCKSSVEIVQIFRNKLNELEPDIEEILKMEDGDKMLQICEKQVREREIFLRLVIDLSV